MVVPFIFVQALMTLKAHGISEANTNEKMERSSYGEQ